MIYRLELTMEQLVLLGGLVSREVDSLEKHCEETLRAIHKHEDMEVPTSIKVKIRLPKLLQISGYTLH